MNTNSGRHDQWSRRRFLQASAAGAGLWWRPLRRLHLGDAHASDRPPSFPAGIDAYRQVFENWALEIRVDDVWTCAPRTSAEIVTLANWAHAHGWRLRPRGRMHGWAPFTIRPNDRADVLLVDTTEHLTAVSVDEAARAFTAQAGALLDEIMPVLEAHGLGMSSIPAPGSITIAGALAVNGHGAALPAAGEDTSGRAYGSLSNRVVSLVAVVWDASLARYRLRRFARAEPATKALLTNLGRAFITEVTLRAEDNVNLRCVSSTDIPASELFAAPNTPATRSFSSFLDEAGRVEAIWFPFTDKPWLKVWSVAPVKPASSREVTQPYNYPFSDTVPLPVARLAKRLVSGHPEYTPQFGQMMYDVASHGLVATNSGDIWGSARLTQHYIKASTLRAAELGYAVITSRANIQRVLHEVSVKYLELVASYRTRGLYPANMPVELRCTTIDDPATVEILGAQAPSLTACVPRADRPEWDVVMWVNFFSLVGTPGVGEFNHDLETWMLDTYDGAFASVRVEWSKGWGYTAAGPWTSGRVLDEMIPDSFRSGLAADGDWDWSVAQLDALDPHRVFTNDFLDRLLG